METVSEVEHTRVHKQNFGIFKVDLIHVSASQSHFFNIKCVRKVLIVKHVLRKQI